MIRILLIENDNVTIKQEEVNHIRVDLKPLRSINEDRDSTINCDRR